MSKVIIVELKDNVISSKARYVDSEVFERMKRCCSNGVQQFMEIKESDIDKYPDDLFTDLKPIKTSNNKNKTKK